MSKNTQESQIKMLTNWLSTEGVLKEITLDDLTNYHFIVEAPPNSSQFIDVIQPKNREDVIVIMAAVQISPDHYMGLTAMPKPKLDEFLWALKFDLLSLETEFIINPPEGAPSLIQLQIPLYFDGMNKNNFMQALRYVNKAKVFIIWKMAQLFGNAPPPSSEPTLRTA